MIRNHIVFSVFICLYSLAVPTVAQAQIPGTENLIKTPEITIGKKASSTYEKLKKVVAELEGAEQALQHDQSELVRCKETLADSAERKRALEKLRAETRFLLKKSPEGSVDPALLPHIKRALEVELELAESLAFLVETYKQEAHEVTAGAHQGKRLLQHLEARLNENPEPVEMSLDEILSYLSDLRMSRISLSLLKARRAGLNEELEQSQKEKSKVHEPPLLPDFAGSPQSREQTLRIREDMVDRHVLLNMLHKLLRKHVTGHINAQLQRIRIEIYAREENLNQLEARQEAVFASLTIPKDDLLAAEDRLRTTEERIASQERRYRQQLKELRLSSPEDNEETTFDAFKAWQVRVAVLQHWLYLLDIEKQVEQFRAASVLVLEQLISRQTIPMEYFDQFKWYLDASRQTKARAELSKRRDAWRQEYARLSLNEPAPGEEEMAAVILDSYQELLDLYDQIDARKWDLEWCAELVRFYRDRYEIGKRDLFWYSWRAGVSLGVLILAILLSLMIGRLTLRPLKKRRQAPGWMRLTLFMTYIGSLILIWTSLLVVTLTQVWGSLFGFAAFGEIFTNTLFTIGDKEVSLSAFIGLIIVLMLTGVVSRMIVRFIQNHIFPYFTWDGGVEDAVPGP